jgi:hypothetical protein
MPPGFFFNKPSSNYMSTKHWEVVCDEHGIGGSGEYCGDNDAHLGRIQGRCQIRSDLTSRPRPELRSFLFTLDLT